MSDDTTTQRSEVLMRLIGLAVILTAGFALAPIALVAQPSDKIYRIGVLERTPAAINAANLEGFRQGLRALGYLEGKNLVIEYRSADGRDDRFPVLAAELAQLKVDLILTRGTPAALAATRAAGTIGVGLETLTRANAQLIVDLAAKHRLPAMYASTEFVGGLASYGVNYPDHYRRAATFADKIFKGAKPADLPVEQPTKLELVINLKTARALGLTIPRTVMLQVDQVIE